MSYSREYYLKHREKYLEATKRYIAKKRAEKNEEWLSERNEYMKNYYKNNPDKREMKREYDKKYREEHKDTSVLIITHYPRILEYINPDFVHIMNNGNIVKTGNMNLAFDTEKHGYHERG